MAVGGTIIDSLLISLGFVSDTSGLESFKRKAEEGATSILKYGAAAGVALGALVTKAVADVSNEFEQNMLVIAGTFSALGVSSDFNAGLVDAEKTLNKITVAAAKLPGEASDYIEVFRAGLTGIKGAMPTGTIDEMVDFSNTFAAVGKSLQVDAGQIGRDLSLLLGVKGHAGADVRTFQKMLPFLMQVQGQAGLTAESFNKMSQAARLDLLRKSFVKLKPMLDASAESFDAMKGAVVSAGKQMIRLGGVALFKGMKVGLGKLNAAFFDSAGKATALTDKVVAFGNSIGRMVTQAVSSMAALVEWFVRSDAAMTVLKTTVGLLALAMAGLAFESVAKGVGTLVFALTNLKRLFTGALVVAIGLVADDLYTFYTGGESVTGMIVAKLGPAGLWLTKVVLGGLVLGLAALRFAFVRTAIAAAASWAMTLWPLTLLVAGIAAVALAVNYLRDHWNEFGAGAKTAIAVVATSIGVLIAALVAAKTAAFLFAMQFWVMAAGAALVASPIYLIVGALAAAGVATFLLLRNWEKMTHGMLSAWQSLGALIGGIPVFGPILSAILSIGGAFDGLVQGMKDAWNSFAETMNSTGVITLPTFSQGPAMLPAGDGVTLPGQQAEGPAEGAWQSPYARRGALPARGTAEGPSYSPSGMAEGGKKGLLDTLKGAFPGVDIASMLGGLGGLQPAAFGGAAGLPPGMLDRLAKFKGGNVTNTQTFTVDNVTVKLDGTATPEQAERMAEAIKSQLRGEASRKNSKVIRYNGSGEEG